MKVFMQILENKALITAITMFFIYCGQGVQRLHLLPF